MYTACVTIDYPQRLKPPQFAALPLIEQLAHGRGKVHDFVTLRQCPELLEQVDRAHRLGTLEHVVVNFDADGGGNLDRAEAFAGELIEAFAHFEAKLGPDNLPEFFAENDGRAYAYIVVHANGVAIDKRLVQIRLQQGTPKAASFS